MSKRRGVVISTNQAQSISKSKSANINLYPQQLENHPLGYQVEPVGYQSGEIEPMANEEMIESNFISEDPPREVNLKHYAYFDPDCPYDPAANRYEENEEEIIESMHKKKEIMQARKKQEQNKKISSKQRTHNTLASKEKRQAKHKQPQTTNVARSALLKSQPPKNFKPKTTFSRKKCSRQNCRQPDSDNPSNQAILKRSVDTDILKPKPLDFSVDMFDRKAMYSPHKRKRDDYGSYIGGINRALTENPNTNPNNEDQLEGTVGANQNLNSHKLPYRLRAFP